MNKRMAEVFDEVFTSFVETPMFRKDIGQKRCVWNSFTIWR